MSGKRWAALGIAVFLFLASIGVNMLTSLLFSYFSDLFSEDLLSEQTIEDGDVLNRIAVLEINGAIEDTGSIDPLFGSVGYNHTAFMEQLNSVKDDRTVKAVIIKVNSPGGAVVQSAEIHDKIVEIQEKAKKPVYISMGTMAASGGYYVAAPAHKIYATPDTITGSLGVMMQGYNFEGLAEKFGVEVVTFKSGPYKDIMSSMRKMTEEEEKILEELIANSYNQFVKVIAEGRGMTESEARALADGRIYDGRQALELGLIDGHGYFEDVLEAVKKEQKLSDPMVFTYSESYGLDSLLFYGSKQLMLRNDYHTEISGLIHALQDTYSPRLMYLYSE